MYVAFCDRCRQVIKPNDSKHILVTNKITQTYEESYSKEGMSVQDLMEKLRNDRTRTDKNIKYYEICTKCYNIIQDILEKRNIQLANDADELNKMERTYNRTKVDLSLYPNIYLVGKAGAGKTYAARYLIEKYGFTPSKFAYPVYDIAHNYFEMKDKDRKLLQVIGTDIARQTIDKNIWVNRFKEDIQIVENTAKTFYDKVIRFVSDDVRFPNEHEILKKMNWLGIYLDVDETIRIRRLIKRDGDAQMKTLKHSSEESIDLFKKELMPIDASGTLEDTQKILDEILAEEKKK